MQVTFGYDNVFSVEPRGRSGGLASFYMNDPSVTIIFSNNIMIDIETSINDHKVYMKFIFDDSVVEYREQFWKRLNQHEVWFMIGDFNEITVNHEKWGDKRRAEASFIPFRTMLDNCCMIYFPHKGNFFSWIRQQKSGKGWCCLDKMVGNEDWYNIFFTRMWSI